MFLELRITAYGRDVDELLHRLRLELIAGLHDIPNIRRRIEAAPDDSVTQWWSSDGEVVEEERAALAARLAWMLAEQE